MRFSNDIIIQDTNITASQFSEVIDIRHIFGYSIQAEWTSTTASASVVIQGSNDGENFVSIGSPVATINNNNGLELFNVTEEQYYGFMRISVDFTSGSVTSLIVTYGSKGV